MRTFKNILLGLAVLLVLLIIVGFVYTNSLKPQYSGSLQLQHLNDEVTTYFDDYGIPHIYANNETDAYRTLGYLHAQDRLWQMELLRRIAPGRLSEILGDKLLKTDKFFATLGIDEASKKAIESVDKNSEAYQLSLAYIDGINQFMNEGPTPIEYTLVGVDKEPYTLKDMYNIFGYMAFSFAQAQKTDPMLTSIQEKLGVAYLKDIDARPNVNGTLIKNSKPTLEAIENLSTEISQITQKLPIPMFVGSNSWVVSPKKTSTGKVMFANDPHIGYAQPSVWYEAHLTTPNYEMYGYHLAGIPFPLLGHNRQYAYGMTMFENDDLDFYKEENHPDNPNQYKTPTGYADYKVTSKTIKVKDAEDVTIQIKTSHHGPIMTGVQDEILGSDPISVWWVYTQHENKVLDAVYKISHAKNMQDFKQGVSLIHAPGLNVMYGDANDNVAWWAAGKLYRFNDDVNPKFVLDGTTGTDEPIEYLNFNDNPMAENPEWGYVYSANNQPDSIVGMLYPGYYLPEDRGRRIVELLEPKNDWNIESFKAMLLDVTSPVAPEVINILESSVDNASLTEKEKTALEILKNWKGNGSMQSVGSTIYQRYIFRYLENTYKDELEETLFNQLLKTHLLKRTIAIQMSSDNSVWWDNTATNDKVETKSDILQQSFSEAISSLETQLGNDINTWTWGKVHTLEHPHALGAVESLRSYFNVGPFEVSGSKEVIDNKAFDFTDSGVYPVNAGPSTRRIVDFSDVENSVSILPTGQSGNPFSKHYDDQAEMYAKGEFRKMMLNKEEIIKTSEKLSITPKK